MNPGRKLQLVTGKNLAFAGRLKNCGEGLGFQDCTIDNAKWNVLMKWREEGTVRFQLEQCKALAQAHTFAHQTKRS
jgi:hypothetical protein